MPVSATTDACDWPSSRNEPLHGYVHVEQYAALRSSRTMLCIQKNDATRSPDVTGVT